MTKYQENFIYTTSFIKELLKIKMVTLLLGHPVYTDIPQPVDYQPLNSLGGRPE